MAAQKKTSFLKRKKVTSAFSAFALISGFVFLNQGVTGNAIITSQKIPGFNTVSLIGLLLVFCSAILAFYSLRKN